MSASIAARLERLEQQRRNAGGALTVLRARYEEPDSDCIARHVASGGTLGGLVVILQTFTRPNV